MNPRETAAHAREAHSRLHMAFDDNSLLSQLFGEGDKHLERIERALGVALASRGNRVAISGPASRADLARAVLTSLYERLKRGLEVDAPAVDAALRMAPHRGAGAGESEEIRTRRRRITPRGPVQAQYVKALRSYDMVFGLGPAGTGKTYLAVACALRALESRKVEKVILSRPVVEAGERLGFLPGDLMEKVNPYLRPLYDAFLAMLGPERFRTWRDNDVVEIVPLAYMRGRTFEDAFMILDEAQNTTPEQIKMFLTRMGTGSKAVVTGDLTQNDLP
ncbi:MAG: PhoH family protein, partial [Stellaceae bacterium]